MTISNYKCLASPHCLSQTVTIPIYFSLQIIPTVTIPTIGVLIIYTILLII